MLPFVAAGAAGTAVSGMVAIAAASDQVDKITGAVKSGAQKARDAAHDTLRAGELVKGTSLVSASKPAQQEPVFLLDATLLHVDWMDDVVAAELDRYIGFFTMVASLQSTFVNGVSVVAQLDALSPSRSVSNALFYSRESYDTAKPMQATIGLNRRSVYDEDRVAEGFEAHGNRGGGSSETVILAKDSVRELREAQRLATGKLVEVTLGGKNKGESITVPIAFRPIMRVVDSMVLVDIMSPGRNRSWTDRWHGWRSGELSTSDFLFFSDLVKHHRKTLLKDKNGVRRDMMRRLDNNRAAAMISGDVSLASISNIMIIDRRTAQQIETNIGGRFADKNVRESFLEDSAVMVLAIVDTDHETVTTYLHSIAEPSEATRSRYKSVRKSGGTNINDIVAALKMSSAPVI